MLPRLANPVVAVVTTADSAFFAHLKNLLASLDIQDHRGHEIFVIDVGLAEGERQFIASRGVKLLKPESYIFATNETTRPYLEVRPSLNNLLSDTDIIIWLDADLWLQSSRYLADLVEFLRNYEFLLSPQVHAAYGYFNFDARFRRRIGRYGYLHGWNFDQISRVYGSSVAHRMAKRSIFNGGVFAGWTHSAFWDYWKSVYERGGAARNEFGIDQIALNVTASIFDGPVGLLPPAYNWLCHFAPPAYDPARRQFVSPVLAHEPLHAIHLAGPSKDKAIRIPVLGGDPVEARLYDESLVMSVLRGERLFASPD